jgi:RimJ/RimL family protein N-acetyltransferase
VTEDASLHGRQVRLRPLTAEDLEGLLQQGQRDFSTKGDQEEQAGELRRLVGNPSDLDADGLLTLAVEHEGVLVGDIQARAPRFGFPPGVCEVGLTLFPNRRGRGLGTEAVRVLTAHLHADGWSRVQSTTAVTNVAMRRVLERCAYEFEGVLRSFAPEGAERADYAMYASTVL